MTIRNGGSPRSDYEGSGVDQAHELAEDDWTPVAQGYPRDRLALAWRERRWGSRRPPEVPRLRADHGHGRDGRAPDVPPAGPGRRDRRLGLRQPERPRPAVREGPRQGGPGHEAHDRAERGRHPGRVRRGPGRHRGRDRHPPGPAGLPARRPGLRLHGHRPRPRRQARNGHVHPAQEHDPGPARHGAPAGRRPGHRPALPRRAAARAGGHEARDAAGQDGSERLLRAREAPVGRRSSPPIPGSSCRRAPRSRGSSRRRSTTCSRTSRRRSSSTRCSTRSTRRSGRS